MQVSNVTANRKQSGISRFVFAALCGALLLAGCGGGSEWHQTERLRIEKEFEKGSGTFQECAAWAAKSLGDDATAPEHLELTNSCLQMRRGLPDNKADTGKAESEETKERELSERESEIAKREREVNARERQARLEALAKLVVRIQEETREVVAVLRELLEQEQYCDVLLNGTRALRYVQEYNQKWREIGVENALIPDDELLGILAVAKAGCQAQSQ